MVGNLMTASYCSGLTLGSLLAYWLDSLLGPPNSNPCPAQLPTLSPPTHRLLSSRLLRILSTCQYQNCSQLPSSKLSFTYYHPVSSLFTFQVGATEVLQLQVLRKSRILLVRPGNQFNVMIGFEALTEEAILPWSDLETNSTS